MPFENRNIVIQKQWSIKLGSTTQTIAFRRSGQSSTNMRLRSEIGPWSTGFELQVFGLFGMDRNENNESGKQDHEFEHWKSEFFLGQRKNLFLVYVFSYFFNLDHITIPETTIWPWLMKNIKRVIFKIVNRNLEKIGIWRSRKLIWSQYSQQYTVRTSKS